MVVVGVRGRCGSATVQVPTLTVGVTARPVIVWEARQVTAAVRVPTDTLPEVTIGPAAAPTAGRRIFLVRVPFIRAAARLSRAGLSGGNGGQFGLPEHPAGHHPQRLRPTRIQIDIDTPGSQIGGDQPQRRLQIQSIRSIQPAIDPAGTIGPVAIGVDPNPPVLGGIGQRLRFEPGDRHQHEPLDRPHP